MNQIKSLHLIPKDLFFKITLLKSMTYCGVLWGLYHQQGWAMMSDHEDFIFPFWLNSAQAHNYAQLHWPDYTPRKITPQDFQESLLPTLTRLKNTEQIRHFFFSEYLHPA